MDSSSPGVILPQATSTVLVWLSHSCVALSLSGSVVKNPPANVGDMGLIPWSRRSPAGGNGNPFQCSCL